MTETGINWLLTIWSDSIGWMGQNLFNCYELDGFFMQTTKRWSFSCEFLCCKQTELWKWWCVRWDYRFKLLIIQQIGSDLALQKHFPSSISVFHFHFKHFPSLESAGGGKLQFELHLFPFLLKHTNAASPPNCEITSCALADWLRLSVADQHAQTRPGGFCQSLTVRLYASRRTDRYYPISRQLCVCAVQATNGWATNEIPLNAGRPGGRKRRPGARKRRPGARQRHPLPIDQGVKMFCHVCQKCRFKRIHRPRKDKKNYLKLSK